MGKRGVPRTGPGPHGPDDRGSATAAWQLGQAAFEAGRFDEARRWQERARRLAPNDRRVALGLATTLFRLDEFDDAAVLFTEAAAGGTRDALLGCAACALATGDLAAAAPLVARLLSGFRLDGALAILAGLAAAGAGSPGWCGLAGADRVQVSPGLRPALHAGGCLVVPAWSGTTARLPRPAGGCPRLDVELAVELDGAPLLGSPLHPAALHRADGFVETWKGGLRGWAWTPADPDMPATLLLRCGDRGRRVVARGRRPGDIPPEATLNRPRTFRVAAGYLAGWDGPIRVTGRDGRDLLGSPLDLRAEGAAPPPAKPPPRVLRPVGARPVDVVVPVYRGLRVTLDCLDSVRDSLPPGSRLHVVEDASPEPALVAALEAMARRGAIRLIRNPANSGFPASANAGLRACGTRDAVLLNSDTLVPPGWIERLRDAAYSAPDIGSVTPLSNDATVCSYPAPGSPAPDAAALRRLDALARRENGAGTVDLPTGVGFCLFLRRDCLDGVGLLREDLFAQGYGEENDWCLRAAAAGWRHVAAPGVFVAHLGSASFGAARTHLVRRNLAVLERLHPGYAALIDRWERADPLLPARRRLDRARWRAAAPAPSAVLVTHKGGGGVDRAVAARCAALRRDGLRPVLLRPKDGAIVVSEGLDPAPSSLRYRAPGEWRGLMALLRAGRPTHVELHHALGHHPGVLGLAAALGVPLDVHVHDYAAFCPRIALVSTGRRYCGEPDLAGCEACVAALGSRLGDDTGVRALVARSADVLGGARRVVVPSRDVAARIRRHFPELHPAVRPLEGPIAAPPAPVVPRGAVLRVLVPGAIGVEKGLDVLAACARDARARALPIEFAVCGHTADDALLLGAGPVHVTGRYAPDEAESLMRAQGAHLAFVPSVWPETWCYALSEAWRAGLRAAVFDLGAQAERVRENGAGWVLPFGLPAPAVNDALLRLAGAPGALHSAPAFDLAGGKR